jgi:hypothetical protein
MRKSFVVACLERNIPQQYELRSISKQRVPEIQVTPRLLFLPLPLP